MEAQAPNDVQNEGKQDAQGVFRVLVPGDTGSGETRGLWKIGRAGHPPPPCRSHPMAHPPFNIIQGVTGRVGSDWEITPLLATMYFPQPRIRLIPHGSGLDPAWIRMRIRYKNLFLRRVLMFLQLLILWNNFVCNHAGTDCQRIYNQC